VFFIDNYVNKFILCFCTSYCSTVVLDHELDIFSCFVIDDYFILLKVTEINCIFK